MKTKEMFAGDFLRADPDLLEGGHPMDIAVTIADVTIEQLGQEEEVEDKYVVHFEELDKGLVLNKTNFKTIMKLHPVEDTDDWIGKRITLYAAEVEFRGETVWGIRVRLRPPKVDDGENMPSEDEVPF